MTEPTPLSKLPELGFARIQVQTSGASLADLEAAVAKVTPPAAPQDAAGGVATHIAAITEIERDLHARRDAVATRLLGAGFEMEYGTLQTTAYRKSDLLVSLPMDDRGLSMSEFERMVVRAEVAAPTAIISALLKDAAEMATPSPACTAIGGKPCVCYAREGDCPHMPGSVDYTSGTLDRATAAPATVEEFLRDLESGDGEPSEGDVADAPLFVGGTDSAPELVARWGQVHTAPPQPMSPDLDGLAAIAARGQQPTAPGPTVAELQQQLAAERARADLLDAEAVSQRQRAEAVEAELFELDHTLHTLGAHGTGSTKEWLLQVLTPEDRRAILEFDVAEARMDLARLRARRLNPAPPEKLAEYAAKVAEVEAKIAALDR